MFVCQMVHPKQVQELFREIAVRLPKQSEAVGGGAGGCQRRLYLAKTNFQAQVTDLISEDHLDPCHMYDLWISMV